jgi:hypothetical protein
MSCSQIPLLQRLTVESPEVVRREPWRSHLAECPACRGEHSSLVRSLVMFRRLEGESREREFNLPDWEDFSRLLDGLEGRRGGFSRLRVPVVAATALMILTAGLLFWPADPVLEPRPARIVTLKPEQHRQLRVVTREPAQPRFVTDATPIPPPPSSSPVLGPPAPPGAKEAEVVATAGPVARPNARENTAPVVLFRSLQQARTMREASGPWPRAPLNVMPASTPYVVDPAFIGRSPHAPQPVR